MRTRAPADMAPLSSPCSAQRLRFQGGRSPPRAASGVRDAVSRGPCPKTSSSLRHLCTAASAGCPRRDWGQVARSPRSPRRELLSELSPCPPGGRTASPAPARRCRSPRPSGPSSLGLPPPGTRSPQLSTHSLPRFLLSTVRAKRCLRLPPSPPTRLIKILKNNTDSCIPFARLANNSVFSSHLEGPSCGSLTTPSPLHAPPNTPRYPPPTSQTRLHVPAVLASCGSPGCPRLSSPWPSFLLPANGLRRVFKPL